MRTGAAGGEADARDGAGEGGPGCLKVMLFAGMRDLGGGELSKRGTLCCCSNVEMKGVQS